MTLYLTQFSYTPETWARLVENPEDRRKAAQLYIESVGGTLHGFWYAFGRHDGYTLWEAPDNVSMAAVALAITSGGALSSFETTVLLTIEETIEALGMVEQIKYRPPGAGLIVDRAQAGAASSSSGSNVDCSPVTPTPIPPGSFGIVPSCPRPPPAVSPLWEPVGGRGLDVRPLE